MRAWALAALTLVVSTLAQPGTTAGATTSPSIRIDFFGDSLSYQASPYLASDFNRGTTVASTSHVYPGTALCDWLGDIDALTTSTAPTVAVLQFVGNHFTSCISGYAPGSAAFIQKYASDLKSAITQLRAVGVKDVLVDVGPKTDDPAITWYYALRSAFVQVVDGFHTSSVAYAWTADKSVETQAGAFAATLPCISHEANAKLCVQGAPEKVRSNDGLHFCPTTVGGANGQVSLCPVYASGAYRFALGLSKVVWSWLPSSRPLQSPLAVAVSIHTVPATGGTSLRVTGTGFTSVRGVDFIVPLPKGGFNVWGASPHRLTSNVVTVTTPNFSKRLGTSSGTVYVSVETASSQSPWGGLTEVRVTF